MEYTSDILVEVLEASEISALVRLSARTTVGVTAPIVALSGELYGPRSRYARTLPTTFALRPCAGARASAIAAEATVLEPSYWTPQLPFLYDVRLDVRLATGESRQWEYRLGLRRVEISGKNIYYERKRAVLRGTWRADPTASDLQMAREADAALIVSGVDQRCLEEADEIGVGLIVELSAPDQSGDCEAPLSWHPSVRAVLTPPGLLPVSGMRRAAPYGQLVTDPSSSADANKFTAELAAFSLAPRERPPSWAGRLERPAMALRRDAACTSIRDARAACDRLQAELAPEFDLAGYFV